MLEVASQAAVLTLLWGCRNIIYLFSMVFRLHHKWRSTPAASTFWWSILCWLKFGIADSDIKKSHSITPPYPPLTVGEDFLFRQKNRLPKLLTTYHFYTSSKCNSPHRDFWTFIIRWLRLPRKWSDKSRSASTYRPSTKTSQSSRSFLRSECCNKSSKR